MTLAAKISRVKDGRCHFLFSGWRRSRDNILSVRKTRSWSYLPWSLGATAFASHTSASERANRKNVISCNLLISPSNVVCTREEYEAPSGRKNSIVFWNPIIWVFRVGKSRRGFGWGTVNRFVMARMMLPLVSRCLGSIGGTKRSVAARPSRRTASETKAGDRK